MKVLLNETTAEIVEKKSRFIANVFYVENVEDAEAKLYKIRKTYYDAKHNCFAYVIGLNGEMSKSSDDGEPSGTAGHPMISILKNEMITNCIAIVTRYFGGVLLGTGGLVRCYSESLKSALANAKTAEVSYAYEVDFSASYDEYGKIENTIQNINQANKYVYSIDKSFTDVVKLKCLIDEVVFDKVKKELIDITRGKAVISDDIKKAYYIDDSEISKSILKIL